MRLLRPFAAICLLAAACAPAARAPEAPQQTPYMLGADAIQVGRHLAIIGGCNDCHTAGYAESGGRTPEADWLKGNPVGHYGPWGTSYASNLRIVAASMSEDEWVQMLKTRTGLPPMPWYILRAYEPRDLRALYQYIRSLGPPGDAAPVALAPAPAAPPAPYYDYMHGAPPPG